MKLIPHTCNGFAGLLKSGALGLCLWILPPMTAEAASVHSTWTGGAGTTAWETNGNWNSTNYPNDGADSYHAWVENSAGSVQIETAGAINLRGFTVTQAGTGSTTLKLGGNLVLSDAVLSGSSGVYNTTGNVGAVVIDLNGHQFSSSSLTASRHNFNTGVYTVKSSAADGTGLYSFRNLGNGSEIDVQDNVTVRVSVATTNYFDGTTWSDGSTLLIANTGNALVNASKAISLGNLTVGDESNAAATNFSVGNSHLTVQGDMVINTYVGASGTASRLSFSDAAAKLRVGGNFTDVGTTLGNYNSSGTLAYVGGASEEKTVSIARTELTNHFLVGDAGAAGNIKLGGHLATTQSVTVQGDSRLNLDAFRLEAGSFTAQEGATLGFGMDGEVTVNGLLTLGSFKLELTGDWSTWENGSDLALFNYETLSGAPTLESFTAPAGLMFDELLVTGGIVYLSNVVIPEPRVVAFFSLAGIFLAGAAIRRARQAS